MHLSYGNLYQVSRRFVAQRVIIIFVFFSSESSDKTIRRINYSQPQRDSHMAVPIDDVENWYRALKKFYDLALSPKNLVEFKLEPGKTKINTMKA